MPLVTDNRSGYHRRGRGDRTKNFAGSEVQRQESDRVSPMEKAPPRGAVERGEKLPSILKSTGKTLELPRPQASQRDLSGKRKDSVGYFLPLSCFRFLSSCSACTRCAHASQIVFADGLPHNIQTGLRFLVIVLLRAWCPGVAETILGRAYGPQPQVNAAPNSLLAPSMAYRMASRQQPGMLPAQGVSFEFGSIAPTGRLLLAPIKPPQT